MRAVQCMGKGEQRQAQATDSNHIACKPSGALRALTLGARRIRVAVAGCSQRHGAGCAQSTGLKRRECNASLDQGDTLLRVPVKIDKVKVAVGPEAPAGGGAACAL